MTKKSDAPAIRFKGFSDAWEQRKFSDVVATRRGLTYKPSDIRKNGVRVLRSSNIAEDSFVLSDEDVFVVREAVNIDCVRANDILITAANGSSRLVGKHTIISGIPEESAVHGGFMLLGTTKEPHFVNASMGSSWYRRFIELFVAGGNGAIGNLNKNDLDNQDIAIPSEKEQKKIGSFFRQLDNLITLHQRQPFLHSTPEISLTVQLSHPFYTSSWEQRKFSDITFPAGEKNRDNLPLESYSITNEHGFVPQDEKFENGGTMREADKRMYYIVSPNSFAYNPARINVGSIGYQNIGKNVIVSSLYEVFKTSEDVDDRLLWHWFKSPDFQKLIMQLQEGGVRLYFYYDKLCMGEVSLPSLEEQRKIGKLFDTLDNLITLHQRKFEKLTNVKKSMLEKMFPQNGSSYPEIRFKGFTDPWEQRKLGEIGSVSMCRRIFKEQTSETGDIPFYKIGTFGAEPDAFISRELFEEYKSKYPYPKKGDILISASGSIGRTVEFAGNNEYFQDSNIVWLSHDERLSNSFLKCFYSVVKWAGIEGSTIKRLYNDNILNTVICMPSVPEQEHIGLFFENLDNLITLHQRELEKLQNIKKSMLEKMFV